MKNLLIILSLIILAVSCNDKETPNILDPTTQITLNAATSKVIPPSAPYSIDTIVRYAMIWSFRSQLSEKPSEGGISTESRDFEAKTLKIGIAEQVVFIDKKGDPQLGLLMTAGLYDVVLGVKHLESKPGHWFDILHPSFDYSQEKDTLGYIPNAVVRKAEADIKAAFNAKDYDECMRLFREAYVFIPITGPEWRELKAKGEN